MRRQTLLALLLISSSAWGAFEQSPHGARALGLGGTTVSVRGDPWSAFVNPACLSVRTGTSAALEYLPALFGIGELERGGISLGRTFSFGTAALSMSTLGFELYREASVQLAGARELSERVALGISLDLYSLAIRGYGSDQALGLDVGILVCLGPGLTYGVALHNANRPSIGSAAEPLPQSLTMGISVQPLPAALVAISAEKDSRFPFELSAGAEYCFEDLLTLRIGVTHEPSTIAAGIGVRTSQVCMDYAYSVHPDLGDTHCFSLSFVVSWP